MQGIYNKKWFNDLDQIINNFPDLKTLSGKTILLTGATGLICSSIIDVIIRFNQINKEKINIIAAGRSEKRVRDRFSDFFNESYFTFLKYDSTKNNNLNVDCDFVIHGASNAFPQKIGKEPVETMVSNIMGIKEILDFAKDRIGKVQRVLYISSSEVYGNKPGNSPFIEDEYGVVDILNPRNSYSESKRAAETLCVAYSKEYNVDVVMVRPGHIYGPTASENDNRVSSMWTYDAANGKKIVMKSDGKQIRSYTYCLDCASAILVVLINGEREKAYNISNNNSIISIKELAECISELSNIELVTELPDSNEKKNYNTMVNSSLDSNKLELLGWKGLFGAREGLLHTIEILKHKSNNNDM